MDPREFCARTGLVIVAGKGGVGKTTTAAILARMAAGAGMRVLVVELGGAEGLARTFGVDGLGYQDRRLWTDGRGSVWGRSLTPEKALLEYLDNHGLARIGRRLSRGGAADLVATAAPGIGDIVVLGKIRQLTERDDLDLVVVDAPASGHALTFLLAPRTLLATVAAGPIRAQAEEALALLTDASRCRVMLVTLAEETPVNEVVQTAYSLDEEVGVDLAPVVVNGLYPVIDHLGDDPAEAARAAGVELGTAEARVLAEAAHFRHARQQLQAAQLTRLGAELALPQLRLPLLAVTGIAGPSLDDLATHLASAVDGLAAVA